VPAEKEANQELKMRSWISVNDFKRILGGKSGTGVQPRGT